MLILLLRTPVVNFYSARFSYSLLSRTFTTTSPSFSSPVSSFKMAEKKNPKGIIVNWDFNHLNKDEVMKISKTLVERLNKDVDKIVGTSKVSYDTVLKPLLETEQWFRNESQLVTFPSNVATEKDLRDASFEASNLIESAIVEVTMRVDLFQLLVKYKEQEDPGLSTEKRRALDKFVRDGNRNGLNLDESTRNEIKKIKNQLNEMSLEFTRNVSEDKWEHMFTREELAGLPNSFLEGLEKDESSGKLKVTLKYPHLFPITKLCKIPETRKIMETANASKAMEANTKILEDILELKDREAKLLGYKNHAAYIQEELMVKNPETVEKFLRDLSVKLQPLWKNERVDWLAFKEQEFKENGWEFNGKLEPWDTRYYMAKIEETQFAINEEDYKAYFPLEHVTCGLLDIYQKLLHLNFTMIPDAPTWHPEVQTYEVKDSRDGTILGYFFLDLHPRDGKYTHNCCIPMQLSYIGGDGKYVPAVTAMVCNFSKPSSNRPSLLDHKEVVTYFHEFGHLMHCICSRTETILFSGADGVEKDFVEAPSQMLENWVWHPTPLALMSKHYESGQSLPKEMIDKLYLSQKANAGALNLRQIALALFDQKIHTSSSSDTAKVLSETMREIIDMDTIPNTNFAASFGHLVHGYSARYYSYMWSEVFSMDMFETVFGNEPLNPDKGLLYREKILQPAGSLDASVMLRNFLGRDPIPEPFLRHKGLETSPEPSPQT